MLVLKDSLAMKVEGSKIIIIWTYFLHFLIEFIEIIYSSVGSNILTFKNESTNFHPI